MLHMKLNKPPCAHKEYKFHCPIKLVCIIMKQSNNIRGIWNSLNHLGVIPWTSSWKSTNWFGEFSELVRGITRTSSWNSLNQFGTSHELVQGQGNCLEVHLSRSGPNYFRQFPWNFRYFPWTFLRVQRREGEGYMRRRYGPITYTGYA